MELFQLKSAAYHTVKNTVFWGCFEEVLSNAALGSEDDKAHKCLNLKKFTN